MQFRAVKRLAYRHTVSECHDSGSDLDEVRNDSGRLRTSSLLSHGSLFRREGVGTEGTGAVRKERPLGTCLALHRSAEGHFSVCG